jgi:hypothetical protein
LGVTPHEELLDAMLGSLGDKQHVVSREGAMSTAH